MKLLLVLMLFASSALAQVKTVEKEGKQYVVDANGGLHQVYDSGKVVAHRKRFPWKKIAIQSGAVAGGFFAAYSIRKAVR